MGNPDEPRPERWTDGGATAPMAPIGRDAPAPVGHRVPTPSADREATPPSGPAVHPPSDATARIPRIGHEGDATQAVPDAARWAGRAEVRRGDTAAFTPQPSGSWDEPPVDPYDGERSLAGPVVLALVILAMLTAVGAGGWLLYRAFGRDDGVPRATPSASVQSSAVPSSAPPSSATPSSASASPAPAGVVVPPVIGVSESTARQALEAVGLSYSVHYEPDGSFPQGTVLTASPEPGSTVPGGSEVALVVAIRPVPSPVEPSPSLSSPPGNE